MVGNSCDLYWMEDAGVMVLDCRSGLRTCELGSVVLIMVLRKSGENYYYFKKGSHPPKKMQFNPQKGDKGSHHPLNPLSPLAKFILLTFRIFCYPHAATRDA